jgi:hypothetical protein
MHPIVARRSFALSLAILAALAAAPAGAAAAGGPAIPGGTWGGAGVTGPAGTPAAEFRYVTIYHGPRGGTTVEKISTDGGVVRQYWSFETDWTLPAVTLLGEAGGLSADGETLVLLRPVYGLQAGETSFRILDTRRLRTRERLTLDGRFSFDAISPDGRLMYLVEYPDPRDPLEYRVRAYDLATSEFRPGRIVDPDEPGEQMTGQPVARQMSPDGRWAYTLYGGGEETFIHALDTERATAVCVDLHEFGSRDLFRLGLEVDPTTGAITVLERRAPAAVVDPETFAVGEPPAAESAADADGGGGLAWIAIGAGAVLLVGAGLIMRRGRTVTRPDSGTEDGVDDLELLVATRDGGDEEERVREPVS